MSRGWALPLKRSRQACSRADAEPRVYSRLSGDPCAGSCAVACEGASRRASLDVDEHHGQAVHLRSEEHTSELQSQSNLVCRLLLEKKKRIDTSCITVN